MSRPLRARAFLAVAAVVAAVLLAGRPVAAHAAPLTAAGFASRVDEAISTVRGAGSAVASGTVAARVAGRVEELLPLGLKVSEGTATITIADNVSVHRLTEGLRRAGDAASRIDAATELTRHLGAMRSALGEAGGSPWDARALASLPKERPVTTDGGNRWLSDLVARILDAIVRWLAGLTGGPLDVAPSPLARAIPAIVVCVPVAIGLWVVVRGLMRRRRRAAGATTVPAMEAAGPVVSAAADLPADPLAFAEGLARSGMNREAVRALYGGAARTLVERGVVAHLRTRTNHEMLRDVALAAPGLAPALEALTDEFEIAWYGHADPGAGGFEQARATYRDLLAGLSQQGGERP